MHQEDIHVREYLNFNKRMGNAVGGWAAVSGHESCMSPVDI